VDVGDYKRRISHMQNKIDETIGVQTKLL
jgi:hypothetical protein